MPLEELPIRKGYKQENRWLQAMQPVLLENKHQGHPLDSSTE